MIWIKLVGLLILSVWSYFGLRKMEDEKKWVSSILSLLLLIIFATAAAALLVETAQTLEK